MPYLTPNTLPEGRDCRALSIPASSEWLAIVSGALTELTKSWNWQQYGAVSVEDCVAAMEAMIAAYYGGCTACTQPGGYRVIRINSSGHVEELNGDGEYVPATGDYYVPPPAAREGGTSSDQICLAATNAVNVLFQLYENITDSFNSSLTEAEALAALVEFLIVTLGAEFAPITYALALVLLGVFGLIYSALSYLTADLWDDNFTQQFICLLIGCASNDAGVVTFDWNCVESALYAGSYSSGFSELQLRLYLQVNYILNFIGGVDALNTAGATTAITTADCSSCNTEHCFVIDFAVTDGSEFGITEPFAGYAEWVAGVGWRSLTQGSNPYDDVTLVWTFPTTLTCQSVGAFYTKAGGSYPNDANNLRALNPILSYGATVVGINSDNTYGTNIGKYITLSDVELAGCSFDVATGNAVTEVIILSMNVRYKGDIPSGWSDNC